MRSCRASDAATRAAGSRARGAGSTLHRRTSPRTTPSRRARGSRRSQDGPQLVCIARVGDDLDDVRDAAPSVGPALLLEDELDPAAAPPPYGRARANATS